MGWFDSDYEATGSSSINQLGQQRHYKNRYISELIISNLRTGKNIATNISDENKFGTTGFIRRFNKRGNYYGFNATLSLEADGSSSFPIELLPVVSLKDNSNTEHPLSDPLFSGNEIPYYKNANTSEMLRKRRRTLKSIGMDIDEISKAVFEAEEIPAIGTYKWSSENGRLWRSSKKACKKNRATKEQQVICDFATEEEWRDSLIENREKQVDGIKNVTDVYTGLFVSMKTLDIANPAALLMTLQPLMGRLKKSPSKNAIENRFSGDNGLPDKAYQWNVLAGSLELYYSCAAYRYVRKRGIVKYAHESGTGKIRKGKGSFEIVLGKDLRDIDPVVQTIVGINGVSGKDGEVEHYIEDTSYLPFPPGQTLPTLEPDPRNPAEWVLPDPIRPGRTIFVGEEYEYKPDDDLCLVLKMQDVPESTGNPTYLEIRLYGLWCEHKIDVERDGEHGKKKKVTVRGGLSLDMDDKDFGDVIVFPLSAESVKRTPTFLRERLARESVCIIVDGITVQEVKWYQSGIFKVILFIVAVALSWWTAGASISLYELAIAVVNVLIINVVIQYVLSLIDSPLLSAILIVILAVMGGVSFESIQGIVALGVEATGTYIQKKFAQDMLKLKEEYDELQRDISEAKKMQDELEDATGMNKKDSFDAMLWISQLPPTDETTEDWYNRVLNRDLIIRDIDNKLNLNL